MLITGISTNYRCTQRIAAVSARHATGLDWAITRASAGVAPIVSPEEAAALRLWLSQANPQVVVLRNILAFLQTE